MKDITTKGIIAGKILKSLTPEEADLIIEQAEETKPSRIKQTKNWNNTPKFSRLFPIQTG